MLDRSLASFDRNSTVKFGEMHALAAPGVHSASWVDVCDVVDGVCLVTFVHPETDDIGDGDVVLAPDCDVWCVWDPEIGWYADDLRYVVDVGEQPTEQQRFELDSYVELEGGAISVRPGWTTSLLTETLAALAAANGRDDLSFVYVEDFRDPALDELEDLIASVEAGDVETYEIAPGIHAASPVLDQLLALDVDEAAELSANIVAALAPFSPS